MFAGLSSCCDIHAPGVCATSSWARAIEPFMPFSRGVNSAAFTDDIKTGGTHRQDAKPVTHGQEFGGYVAPLGLAEAALEQALLAVHALAIGGSAGGASVNTQPEFGARVAPPSLLLVGVDLIANHATDCCAADGSDRAAAGQYGTGNAADRGACCSVLVTRGHATAGRE